MYKQLQEWLERMLAVNQNNLKVRHFIRTKFMIQNFKNANEASHWLYLQGQNEKLSDEVMEFIEEAMIQIDSGSLR